MSESNCSICLRTSPCGHDRCGWGEKWKQIPPDSAPNEFGVNPFEFDQLEKENEALRKENEELRKDASAKSSTDVISEKYRLRAQLAEANAEIERLKLQLDGNRALYSELAKENAKLREIEGGRMSDKCFHCGQPHYSEKTICSACWAAVARDDFSRAPTPPDSAELREKSFDANAAYLYLKEVLKQQALDKDEAFLALRAENEALKQRAEGLVKALETIASETGWWPSCHQAKEALKAWEESK